MQIILSRYPYEAESYNFQVHPLSGPLFWKIASVIAVDIICIIMRIIFLVSSTYLRLQKHQEMSGPFENNIVS